MSAPPPGIDPVNAAAVVLTAFLSPAAAYVLGAYSIIFVGAVVGAGWALLRRSKRGLASAFGFVTLMTVTSTLFTAGLAHGVNKWLQLENVNYLLAPLAILVSGVGEDWGKVLPWMARKGFDLLLANITRVNPGRRDYDDDQDPTPPNRKF